jgi:hypothetical protein
VQIVIAYILLTSLACVLARILWRFSALCRLDNRVLGERGVATVASVAAVLLVAATERIAAGTPR